MERDPRDRFDDLEELRFGDEPEVEPQPEPDERTTFDRARFDVFDFDLDSEPDLVFTPEPDTSSNPEPPTGPQTESIPEELVLDLSDFAPPDWITEDPISIDDDIPFELLTLDVFDDDEDDLG